MFESMKSSVNLFVGCLLICACTNVSFDKALDYQLVHSRGHNDNVNPDSLKMCTALARDTWENVPWRSEYSPEHFMSYVLPYRVASEPLEYYWREDAYEIYRPCLSHEVTDVKEACRILAESIYFDEDNALWKNTLQSYSKSAATKRGKCDDACIYKAMVMRSFGLPVAVETIPCWGDHNNGHSFNALVMPDDSCVGFNNPVDLKKRLNLQRKIPRIYRHMFETQVGSLLYRYKNTEFIPEELGDFHIMDVTSSYSLSLSELCVRSVNRKPSRIAYLSVFSPSGWKPVAWTELENGQTAKFCGMGTGFLYDALESGAGENIGDGIVYLPVYYDRNGWQMPLEYPHVLKKNNVAVRLKPDMTSLRSMTLKRKYPRKARVLEFAETMVEGYFEGSCNSDFSDAELLYYILSRPESYMQKVKVNASGRKFRYVRYTRRRGGLSLGEMEVYGTDGLQPVEGIVICDKVLEPDKSVANINDGDCLTYFDSGKIPSLWVGLDLSVPVQIDSIGFCPRTDDNDIAPGDEYELFYWDNEWISLGRKTAVCRMLTFDGVPSNALFWLRDLTKGREERPFIYEDERQIWY